MNDSVESSGPWLLLIHQLPPKPDYLRVKVRRRLQSLGAVALKNTVYVLPNQAESLEDFEWLRAEIEADGGSATLVAATLVAGLTDAELRARFAKAEGKPAPNADEGSLAAVRGSTWVTRAGVFVDRIASAWLIRRFIDPEATFKFVAGKSYRPRERELRFDMYQGEYTHEGNRCTFETLLARFGLGDDPALEAIAEIVHDVDLKDEKFGRAETAGVAAVLAGMVRALPNDLDRIRDGSAIFEGLYAQLGGGA